MPGVTKNKKSLPNRFGYTAIKYSTAHRIITKISRAIKEVNRLRASLGKAPLRGSLNAIISHQFSQYLNKNPPHQEIPENLVIAIKNRIIKNKWSWFSSNKKSLSKSEENFLASPDHDKLADIIINESHRAICDEMVSRGEISYVGHGPWRHAKLGANASPKFRQAFTRKITVQIQKNLDNRDQHLFNNHGFNLAQLEWAAKRANNTKQGMTSH
ncbi:MAG: hypothetical protein GY821_14240 [Gammaproteobacteria bacterium]|nr:hypothetical protein [Gammaproteobacteria bacterium]